jgi:hypothetical protein
MMSINEINGSESKQCVLVFDLPTHFVEVRPALCIVSVWVTGESILCVGIVLQDGSTE